MFSMLKTMHNVTQLISNILHIISRPKNFCNLMAERTCRYFKIIFFDWIENKRHFLIH